MAAQPPKGDVAAWTVPQLKARCKELVPTCPSNYNKQGLKVSGKKADLVSRLTEHAASTPATTDSLNTYASLLPDRSVTSGIVAHLPEIPDAASDTVFLPRASTPSLGQEQHNASISVRDPARSNALHGVPSVDNPVIQHSTPASHGTAPTETTKSNCHQTSTTGGQFAVQPLRSPHPRRKATKKRQSDADPGLAPKPPKQPKSGPDTFSNSTLVPTLCGVQSVSRPSFDESPLPSEQTTTESSQAGAPSVNFASTSTVNHGERGSKSAVGGHENLERRECSNDRTINEQLRQQVATTSPKSNSSATPSGSRQIQQDRQDRPIQLPAPLKEVARVTRPLNGKSPLQRLQQQKSTAPSVTPTSQALQPRKTTTFRPLRPQELTLETAVLLYGHGNSSSTEDAGRTQPSSQLAEEFEFPLLEEDITDDGGYHYQICLVLALSVLPYRDLVTCERVCKQWRRAALRSWPFLLQRDYPGLRANSICTSHPAHNLKLYYKQRRTEHARTLKLIYRSWYARLHARLGVADHPQSRFGVHSAIAKNPDHPAQALVALRFLMFRFFQVTQGLGGRNVDFDDEDGGGGGDGGEVDRADFAAVVAELLDPRAAPLVRSVEVVSTHFASVRVQGPGAGACQRVVDEEGERLVVLIHTGEVVDAAGPPALLQRRRSTTGISLPPHPAAAVSAAAPELLRTGDPQYPQ
ncbi:hypothetical protein DFJ73DRAFT_963548, partial [Zopfochytrium polystomum]